MWSALEKPAARIWLESFVPCCDQANANEIPFTLGDAHEHRDIELPSRRDYRFQSNQVRCVEMTQCDMPLIRVFEKVA